MYVAFVAQLARPAAVEAPELAARIGGTEYEVRLALSAPAPAIVLVTTEQDRAFAVAEALRARGHVAHVFDGASFVPSERMGRLDEFAFDPDGLRRSDGELLPYGDVFAILRAVHDTSTEGERTPLPLRGGIGNRLGMGTEPQRALAAKSGERENVAYFFRRSGDRPWILREQHASYAGLGADRQPVAFAIFARTLARFREQATSAISDDRLVRRRVPERASPDGLLRTSRDGVDLLAHLLAMTIARQGGSPYR